MLDPFLLTNLEQLILDLPKAAFRLVGRAIPSLQNCRVVFAENNYEDMLREASREVVQDTTFQPHCRFEDPRLFSCTSIPGARYVSCKLAQLSLYPVPLLAPQDIRQGSSKVGETLFN